MFGHDSVGSAGQLAEPAKFSERNCIDDVSYIELVVNVFIPDVIVFNVVHRNAEKYVKSTDGRTQHQAFIGAQFEGPGFTAMQDGVDRYCQEDQMLGKYIRGFVAEEARQGSCSNLLCSFADTDGDVSVDAEEVVY